MMPQMTSSFGRTILAQAKGGAGGEKRNRGGRGVPGAGWTISHWPDGAMARATRIRLGSLRVLIVYSVVSPWLQLEWTMDGSASGSRSSSLLPSDYVFSDWPQLQPISPQIASESPPSNHKGNHHFTGPASRGAVRTAKGISLSNRMTSTMGVISWWDNLSYTDQA